MEFDHLEVAVTALEKANINLDHELLTADVARRLLEGYARAEKLASFGKAVLAGRINNATQVARATGTSIGKAKQAAETGAALADAPEVGDALASGAISLDQAGEIAVAEQARPGSAEELLAVAHSEAFHVLRDKARKIRLEAEQKPGSRGAPEVGPLGAQLQRRVRDDQHQPQAGAARGHPYRQSR
jgi:hypothetical protein